MLVAAARPLQTIVAAPHLLFLGTIAVMLFRPPDVRFFALDRVLFGLVTVSIAVRICVLRLPIRVPAEVTWPMLGLLLLSAADLIRIPFEVQSWSVFAAKWMVPFTFYVIAQYVFADSRSLRNLELFAIVVLAYLIFIAVASGVGATALVFPRYILDENLGIHADRARGPFLQAVANGVSLNLLGLLAVNAMRRGRLRGAFAWLLMAAFPVAIVATKTRAVWLSFTASAIAVLFLYRRARRLIAVAAIAAALAVSMFSNDSLRERVQDESPVEYRMAVYEAGWHMFTEKPVLGWPAGLIQSELFQRVSGFKVDAFYFHDTYLEIAVQHGLLGLGLYVWIIVDLMRLGRKSNVDCEDSEFLDSEFRPVWRLMVMVYLVNASFVVMNYQFVNALLFTIAGLLSAQNRRARFELHDAN